MSFDTTFGKKSVRGAILCACLGAVMLFTPLFVSADTDLVDDDFESYNLGDLNNQGSWTGSIKYDVVDTKPFTGAQSINCLDCGSATHQFNYPPDGKQSTGYIFFNTFITTGVSGSYAPLVALIGCKELQPESCYLLGGAQIWDNDFGHRVGGDFTELKADIEYDVWHKVGIYFDEPNWQFKVKIDTEIWSEFVAMDNPEYAGLIDAIYGIIIYVSASNSEYLYLDDFSGEPTCALGDCILCETYGTCMSAGCFWSYEPYFYALFGKGGWCSEPYEPEDEECGSYYKCQFCSTQAFCEAELNCAWEDRGLGEKCYMELPEAPVGQVEWEQAELEDCESLEGVERWLCDIKNFIAGAFMPTQEAFEKLHQTFGNFRDKFPFNYIGAFNAFFDDVRISLDEEKDIPIKILGQESEVDFSFWDKITTIGGEEEALKNVIFDFTSFIIFMAWFVWLISIIKRFL